MRLFNRLNIAILSSLITLAAADFHVFNCWTPDHDGFLTGAPFAVPSNQYQCYGPGQVQIDGVTSTVGPDGFGSVFVDGHDDTWDVRNLCGVEQVDAYLDATTGAYNLYHASGDGSVIGSCVPMNPAGNVGGCPGKTQCQDTYVCYSDVVCPW